MTREEAFQKAIDAGIPANDITEADLKSFGYEAPDPTAGMVKVAPAVSDDQVKQDVADAQAEAASNTAGAQALDGLGKAAAVVGTLAGVGAKI